MIAVQAPTLVGNAAASGVRTAELSDEQLMSSHVAGNPVAFRQLFDRHAPRVFAAMRRRGLSDADAQDLVQHTFLLLHQARRDYNPKQSVRPWLWTIAFNAMRTTYRSRMRAELRAQAWAEQRENSQLTIFPTEERQSVQNAVKQLPERSQEVVVLHWYEGLSFAEVAQVVGATESAVKVRAHRAYQQMRTTLSESNSKLAAGDRDNKSVP